MVSMLLIELNMDEVKVPAVVNNKVSLPPLPSIISLALKLASA